MVCTHVCNLMSRGNVARTAEPNASHVLWNVTHQQARRACQPESLHSICDKREHSILSVAASASIFAAQITILGTVLADEKYRSNVHHERCISSGSETSLLGAGSSWRTSSSTSQGGRSMSAARLSVSKARKASAHRTRQSSRSERCEVIPAPQEVHDRRTQPGSALRKQERCRLVARARSLDEGAVRSLPHHAHC